MVWTFFQGYLLIIEAISLLFWVGVGGGGGINRLKAKTQSQFEIEIELTGTELGKIGCWLFSCEATVDSIQM